MGKLDLHKLRKKWRTWCLCALVVMMLLCMCGCRPTDFFTEIVISPFAETEYENSDDVNTINSPDATQESADLVALDWTETSYQSETVNTVVTYSSTPNVDLTTHHSYFSFSSIFKGTESSDGVRLIFSTKDEEDQPDEESDADEEDESNEEQETISRGADEVDESEQTTNTSSDVAQASGDHQNEEGEEAEDATGGDEGETDAGGEAGEEGAGSSEGDEEGTGGYGDEGSGGSGDGDDGQEEDPYAGYDGTVKEYDPNDAFATVQAAANGTVAVIGSNAAIMVQALGGKGAISAMTQYAYDGVDSNGDSQLTASTFAELFADQLVDGFEDSCILWKEDGSRSALLKDIDALVEACGEGGVIVYEQTLGSQTTLFNEEQRKHLQAADIQMVPVDYSTVQGIVDAAKAIGKALKGSETCEKDASSLASTYTSTMKKIIKACGATHGNTLATGQIYCRSMTMTTYSASTGLTTTPATTNCYIAVDSECGVVYRSSYGTDVDSTDILLFCNDDYTSTPLLYWEQVAGVWNGMSDSVACGLRLCWPLYRIGCEPTYFTNYSSTGAFAAWTNANYVKGLYLNYTDSSTASGLFILYDGLGTKHVPYFIVSPSDGKTAAEVKELTVNSMLSWINTGVYTPYSILLQDASIFSSSSTSSLGVTTVGCPYGVSMSRTEWTGNPYMTAGLSASDTVRENPCGLVSKWTEGNMESVLEAIWLTDLYSKSPDGCDYTPVTDMSDFSVVIGEYTCTTTKEAVVAFYKTFYDVDVTKYYNDIVTDEGL